MSDESIYKVLVFTIKKDKNIILFRDNKTLKLFYTVLEMKDSKYILRSSAQMLYEDDIIDNSTIRKSVDLDKFEFIDEMNHSESFKSFLPSYYTVRIRKDFYFNVCMLLLVLILFILLLISIIIRTIRSFFN